MGYNTVIVVFNDNMNVGACDPEIGSRIQSASMSWPIKNRATGVLDIYARSDNCSASYGSVISQDHADGYQVVIVTGNCGWRADDPSHDKYLGWQAFDTMKECLERNGYRVTKKREITASADKPL